jgi:hypothetical protein
LLTATPALDLNLDTLAAFLERRFPDREHAPRTGVAELADELLRFGYETISDVEAMLAETAEAFAESEQVEPPRAVEGARFVDVGVVRMSLAKTNPAYRHYQLQDRQMVGPDDPEEPPDPTEPPDLAG